MNRWGFDDVRGVVIGKVDTKKHYTFYDNNSKMFDSGNFENDKDAEFYVKEKYPNNYKNGVEMRCFYA